VRQNETKKAGSLAARFYQSKNNNITLDDPSIHPSINAAVARINY
jgi:hypothetical protein